MGSRLFSFVETVMAAIVKSIPCPDGVWTPISAGEASVAFLWRDDTGYGKWTVSDTEPSVDTDDYMTLRPKHPQSLNDLAISDRIWVMSFVETQKIEVVTS